MARAIAGLGYEIHPQVGVAGFFVDLAVRDPKNAGRYLLGIECDGATYHSSRSARDRDRLRQQVLEDRGWKLHRIWSTDWFQRPDEQLRKALAAIEAAQAGRAGESHAAPHLRLAEAAIIVRQDEEPDIDSVLANGDVIEPYVEASFRVPFDRSIVDISVDELAAVLTSIVAIESPIHADEIARRAVMLWGKERVSRRISEAVEEALARASSMDKIAAVGRIYSNPKQLAVPVRSRAEVQSATLRRPEMLPPVELEAAVEQVASRHLGINASDAVVRASRLLGFLATSGQIRELLSQAIQTLVADGKLELRNERLYLPKVVGP